MWSRKSRLKTEPEISLIRIILPRAAMKTVFDECDTFPEDETGGRTIGTYTETGGQLTITVSGIIEPGPEARRSRVSLFQDGPYQESVFRKVEEEHPEIEHLGSWHTHHVNGLPHLSGGDIETYTRTVNHKNHNTSFFYALLVTAKNNGGRGLKRYQFKHYVFRRGETRFYEIPESQIEYTDTPLLWPIPDEPKAKPGPKAKTTPPVGDTIEEWPGRVKDRDLLGELYPEFRSFTSPQLGFYWRGKMELVDNSVQDVLVLEDPAGQTPTYSIVLRDPSEVLEVEAKTIGEAEFASAGQALATAERAMNRALFNKFGKHGK